MIKLSFLCDFIIIPFFKSEQRDAHIWCVHRVEMELLPSSQWQQPCLKYSWDLVDLLIRRTIQAGRSVLHPPAQGRVTIEIRPGCWRVCPPAPWKPPRMKPAQPRWETCSNALLVPSWQSFSLFLVRASPALVSTILGPPTVQHHEEPG